MRKHSAQHYASNRAQYADRMKLRTSRENKHNSKIEEVDPALRKMLGDKCRYCEISLDGGGELDHLTPVARGGSGKPGNITWACLECNRAKLAKTLLEFMAWRRERGLPVREIQISGEAPDKPTRLEQRLT